MSAEFDESVRLEYYRAGVDATREIGAMALKFLITLNSGAFVVLLTFIGNSAAQSQFEIPLSSLRLGMYLFLAGISLSFVTIAYSYFASQQISPYPSPTKTGDRYFVPIVLLVAGCAFLAFVVGVVTIVANVGVPK
ncbi:hypothetical protein [Sulfitobacter sp. R18_1]|uniref:hypothetical protein n=1 Tax=Sulfitobacter sp. R18_1 TaxID=2821104 RepID=UPI001ADC58FE|nr:hypothetical protein [Sulfitobacter sp. R18_1]MBO9429871.1 hypothetical protein [Sulfitobacter sp. R18_1]